MLVRFFASVLFFSLFISSSSTAYCQAMLQEEIIQFWNSHFNKEFTTPDCTLTMHKEVLATSDQDECFNGVGVPYPAGPPCGEGQPKLNQAYLFSMVKTGPDIWFGTSANQFCTVLGTYIATINQMIPIEDFALKTESFVCEFGFSSFKDQFVPTNPNLPKLPDSLGDWRPPKFFVYNTQTKLKTDKTPNDPLVQDTLGIRASGAFGDIVILGGPNLIASFFQGDPSLVEYAAINLFAFKADTGEYLGSKAFPEYLDIRKWIVAGDCLYSAVRSKDGKGRVLKWIGNPNSTDINELLKFEEVGRLDAEGAELTVLDGRLFVSTWATPTDEATSGIYMSPSIPPGGLTGAHMENWTKIWGAENYEPDPVLARAYFMGAMTAYDGYVYWGTINFPLVSFLTHMMVYEPTETEDLILAFLGSWRNISIFRAKGFPDNPVIEVVNGLDMLPAYSPDDKTWSLQPNRTGPVLYGLSGFGNIFNSYTWTMEAYGGQLYVGTMDWSFMAYDVGKMLFDTIFDDCEECREKVTAFVEGFLADHPEIEQNADLLKMFLGADLWRFSRSDAHALPESLNGLGNYAAYGLRNMLVDDGLYIGTANVANLMADTSAIPHGGWELIRLTELAVAVETDKTVISADGSSTATITALVTHGDGIRVPDGTSVTFTTDHGSFASPSITTTTVNGVATAILTSEASGDTLVATVIARVCGVRNGVAVFFIPEGTPGGVDDVHTAEIIGSGSTEDTTPGIAKVSVKSLLHTLSHYVTTAEYSDNPCSGALPNVQRYWDLHFDDVLELEEVKITFSPAQRGDKIYYCGCSGWRLCSSQTYRNSAIEVTINPCTNPDLMALSGLPFALAGSNIPPAMPVPTMTGYGLVLMALLAAALACWILLIRRSRREIGSKEAHSL